MEKIKARDLLAQTTEQLWTSLQPLRRFILVFDDGKELEVNWKETVYSSYGWDFHRLYPKTPLLITHHVRQLLGKKRLSPKTHLTLLGNIAWNVHDADPSISLDVLAHQTYLQTGVMYNDLTIKLEAEVGSIDILDFCQVLDSPTISEINNNIVPSEQGISDAYEGVMKALDTEPELYANPLAKAGRSGIVNRGQLLQCLTARGYLTDTDSTQYREPILRGYADGLRLFYDSLIESRSAAKALIFSKKPLQDAEYFSRRLQLMDQIVRNLHHGDCGSKEYMVWHVQGPQYDEKGKEIFSGDLPRLAGKYYLDEETNSLKEVFASDKHLIGKKLKFRTVLECQHPDPYGICSTCFGGLSKTVPANSNIGHMCCTSMTQKSSQNVLSTKHLDTSAAVEPVRISHGDRKYLAPSSDGSSYLIEKNLKGKLWLVVSSKQAANITDILEVKNVEDLNISRVSQLTELGLIVDNGKVREELTIPVGLERRMASMSYALLEHIKKNGFNADENGNYVIDMDGWNKEEIILSLPLRHYNMSDHSRDIAALLESTVKDMKKRDKIASPASILQELYELVNSKLDVNLAILEVVLYGIMIQSAEKYNYHLPKPWTDRGIGVMEAIMQYRSLGVAMAFEDHRVALTNPISYLLDDRPDHPLDFFLVPDQAQI